MLDGTIWHSSPKVFDFTDCDGNTDWPAYYQAVDNYYSQGVPA